MKIIDWKWVLTHCWVPHNVPVLSKALLYVWKTILELYPNLSTTSMPWQDKPNWNQKNLKISCSISLTSTYLNINVIWIFSSNYEISCNYFIKYCIYHRINQVVLYYTQTVASSKCWANNNWLYVESKETSCLDW